MAYIPPGGYIQETPEDAAAREALRIKQMQEQQQQQAVTDSYWAQQTANTNAIQQKNNAPQVPKPVGLQGATGATPQQYTPQQYTPQAATSAQQYTPAQAYQPQMPQGITDQINNVKGLSTAYTPEMEIAMRNRIRSTDTAQNAGATGRIKDYMAASGLGGSGQESAAIQDMIRSQNATRQGALSNLDINNAGLDMQNQYAKANMLSSLTSMGEQSRQFDVGQGNNMAQFNAGMGLNYNQLNEQGRQFDTGQANNMSQFNAGMGLNYDQLAEQSRQYDTGQANNMSQFGTSQGNATDQYNRSLAAQSDQFNTAQGNNMLQWGKEFDWSKLKDEQTRKDYEQQLALLYKQLGLPVPGSPIPGSIPVKMGGK